MKLDSESFHRDHSSLSCSMRHVCDAPLGRGQDVMHAGSNGVMHAGSNGVMHAGNAGSAGSGFNCIIIHNGTDVHITCSGLYKETLGT